jgi:hypothetical protein
MDSLITALVLMIVSAIAAWMKKKSVDGRDDSTANPPQARPAAGQPRPSPRPTSWEEELRRLLGEQSAPPPPVRPPPMMRPPPPPVVVSRPQPASPAPPVVIKPVLVPTERRAAVSVPRSVVAPMLVPSGVEVSAAQLAPLRQSKEAYERASQLDKNVAEHIDRVPGQRVLATKVLRRTISPEITQAVSMFKSGQTARQAVMASLVLGPPRALEEMSPGW